VGAAGVGAPGVPQEARAIAVARVVVLCADLLFGSRLEGALRAAGHDVDRLGNPEAMAAAAPDADVLVVDLTDPSLDGMALVERGAARATRTLGFYAHVEVETRRRAEAAGFDRVVPRSRMAREAGALVDVLAAEDRPDLGA
jgi:CheY-like chemotaxis protein